MEDFLTPQQAFGAVVLVAVVAVLLIWAPLMVRDLLAGTDEKKGGEHD